MDAFREELARRIRAFVAAEIGRERMALNEQMSGLTDAEMKELVEVGRERGMQALLQPPACRPKQPQERNLAQSEPFTPPKGRAGP